MTIQRSSLYYISVLLFFFKNLIQYSQFYSIIPPIIPTVLYYGAIASLALKLFLDVNRYCYSKKMFLMVLSGLIVLTFGGNLANDYSIVWILINIVAARNTDPYKLAKWVYTFVLIATVIIIICSLIGVIPNLYQISISTSGKVIFRYYLGFIHCNVLGTYLSLLFFCKVYLCGNNIKWQDYIVLGVFIVLTMFVAYSRTNGIIMIAMFLVKPFFSPKMKKVLGNVVLLGMIIICLLSIILTINYDPSKEWMVNLNTFMTGRLSAGNLAYQEDGISILGQNFTTIFQSSNFQFGDKNAQQKVVDNAFMHLLIHYGIIPSVILIGYFLTNVKWLIENEKYTMCLIVVMSYAMGISEGTLYSTQNIVLYLLATLQYDRIKEGRKDGIQSRLYY